MILDLNSCTLKEAINYSLTKVIEQGGPAVAKNGPCMYIAGERRCVIGWLIDHSKVDLTKFEGPLQFLLEKHPDVIPDIVKRNLSTFSILQTVHDAAVFLEDSRLYLVSACYYLEGNNLVDPALIDKWINTVGLSSRRANNKIISVRPLST